MPQPKPLQPNFRNFHFDFYSDFFEKIFFHLAAFSFIVNQLVFISSSAFYPSFSDIKFKQAGKDVSSDDSLKSMAVAGVTAALTFGITQGIDAMANSGNVANSGANNLSSSGNLSNASQLPTGVDSTVTYNPSSFGNFASSGSNLANFFKPKITTSLSAK